MKRKYCIEMTERMFSILGDLLIKFATTLDEEKAVHPFSEKRWNSLFIHDFYFFDNRSLAFLNLIKFHDFFIY